MVPREQSKVGVARALARGLAKRCPHCGINKIFEGFYRVRPSCTTCGLRFRRPSENHLGVMYLTTAVQTAAFAALVLVFQPAHVLLMQVLLASGALTLFFLNMPNRKGLAIALDYLSEPW